MLANACVSVCVVIFLYECMYVSLCVSGPVSCICVHWTEVGKTRSSPGDCTLSTSQQGYIQDLIKKYAPFIHTSQQEKRTRTGMIGGSNWHQ